MNAPVSRLPGEDPWVPVVLGLLGAGVVAGALSWAGAVLASWATGHPASPPMGDVAVALGALAARPGAPAKAWPAPFSSHVPGAIAYWGAQLVVVGTAVAAAGMGRRRWTGRSAARPLGVRADAGLAHGTDLRRLAVRRPEPGRLTLGRAGARLMAAEPAASLAVIGPTGCGKTAGFAIPALLEWEGPVIATSVKADLIAATAAHRRRRGTVWVYDPTGASEATASCWSPLGASGSWGGAQRTAAWLAEAARPRRDSVTDGDYWYTQARRGLGPYLFAAAAGGLSMGELVSWVDAQHEAEVRELLEDMAARDGGMVIDDEEDLRPLAAADIAGAEHALVVAEGLWSKEERIRGSVFATMENVVAPWADPRVAASAATSDIDFDEWLRGDNTIYVVAAAHEQARLRPVLSVLVQQAVRAAYDTAASCAGGRLTHPCLVLLDEAANIAPLPDLPAYAATARAYAITVVSIWQDLAQAETIYAKGAQSLLNNHRAKLFGSGVADLDTLRYVSDLVGDVAQVERSANRDLATGRRSVAERRAYRRLAPVDLLRRIRPGQGLLVYGSELPVHLQLRPWYADRGLRSRSRAS